jgi:hypothetical protein
LFKLIFPLLNVLSSRQSYLLVKTLLMSLLICIQIVHMFMVYLRLLTLLT